MEVKINWEIKDYNETIFFGLSVRQFLFALLACGAAVGVYFGCRSFLGTEVRMPRKLLYRGDHKKQEGEV